jgi:hypothetical protein
VCVVCVRADQAPDLKHLLELNVISDNRREVAEHRAVLDYYALSSGNALPTFRSNLFDQYSEFENPKERILDC